jgi:hypothetical protein
VHPGRGTSDGLVSTNVTRAEFEAELTRGGWARNPSADGTAVSFSRDGRRYSLRDVSTDGVPTADYFVDGVKKAVLSIRLASP